MLHLVAIRFSYKDFNTQYIMCNPGYRLLWEHLLTIDTEFLQTKIYSFVNICPCIDLFNKIAMSTY